MKAPVKPGSQEAQVLEAKFGLGMGLSCLLMLITIGQTVLCCREVCERRCCRTQDAYSGHNGNDNFGVQVQVQCSKWATSSFSSPHQPMKNDCAPPNPPNGSSMQPRHLTQHRQQLQPLLSEVAVITNATNSSHCLPSVPPPLPPRPRPQPQRPAPPPPISQKDSDKEHLLS